MIYDNIKNIGLYKGISAALDVALDYIAAVAERVEASALENGTTLLEHGVKAIVSSYVTKEVNPKGYEAHLIMRCCPLEYLTPATEYDEAKDCRFYVEQPGSGCDLRLGAGYFAVVFPDDAHIPQLAAGTPAEVKKIVMKVPVD